MILSIKTIIQNKRVERILIVFSYLLFWYFLALIINNEIILPSPTKVANEFYTNYLYYLVHSFITIKIILLGLLPAIAIGWLLAFLFDEFKGIEKIFNPLIKLTQLIPKTALIPVFIVVIGYNMQSKLLITFLISFYPVFVDVKLGLNKLGESSKLLFRSFNANRIQTIRYLKIPHSYHYLLNGTETAILYSIVGAITAEILMARDGIGYIIAYNSEKLNMEKVFTGLLITVLIGLGMLSILALTRKIDQSIRKLNRSKTNQDGRIL